MKNVCFFLLLLVAKNKRQRKMKEKQTSFDFFSSVRHEVNTTRMKMKESRIFNQCYWYGTSSISLFFVLSCDVANSLSFCIEYTTQGRRNGFIGISPQFHSFVQCLLLARVLVLLGIFFTLAWFINRKWHKKRKTLNHHLSQNKTKKEREKKKKLHFNVNQIYPSSSFTTTWWLFFMKAKHLLCSLAYSSTSESIPNVSKFSFYAHRLSFFIFFFDKTKHLNIYLIMPLINPQSMSNNINDNANNNKKEAEW